MDSIRSRPKSLIVEDSSLSRLKCQHTPSLSADLAPVHTSGSKHLNQVQEMESKVNIIDSDPFNSNLSSNFQEKLSLNSKFKAKNCNKNGIRLGTTDVEVHCGPSSPGSAKVFSSKSAVADVNSTLGSLSPSQQAQVNSQSSQENKINSLIGFCSNNSKSHRPTSVNSTSLINFKPELNITTNGTICNGHTVSEATSSNSLAISDLSISSDKSTSLDSSSYSCPGSGARPRTRNTSNSSSQSTQPQSECEVDLSFTSESSKLHDGSLIPDPVPIFTTSATSREKDDDLPVVYVNYENEHQMEAIMRLIQKDLSEPYSIYTYRYFIHNWPKLCFLAMNKGEVVGAIVCKLDLHKKATVRGYIAMLAVDHRYRKRRIGSNLVLRAIREMAADDADEVVLETEITNKPALQLYENLGFVRDKRLFRYYLNGVDALRLKLWLR